MILKQYYLGCLAHASYLVADEATGEAAVVDPQRDVDQYIDDARRLGCRIEHVLLTHFHADFVAGHLELRDRAGARIYLGARADADYEFTPLGDGESVRLGQVVLEALETPGHSPESISILIYDLSEDEESPHAVLTGDTLFVGDVGRPDLRAASGWSAERLGGLLHESLHAKLLTLPDETLVYPAHGAGSLCGRNLGSDTVSTIGAQRRHNYALRPMGREEFVEVVTADQPDTPAYFAYDAILNTRERPTLEQALAAGLRPLPLDEVLALLAGGAQLLDSREPADFAAGHLAGSVNVGLGGNYATWAGTVLDRDRPIVIVADPGREAEAAMRLGRIGFDHVAGHLAKGVAALARRPELVETIERVDAATLAERLDGPAPPLLLDVRSEREHSDRCIAPSVNIPLAQLRDRVGEVPRDRAVVVHCATGYRSSIAASLLRRHGCAEIADLADGLAGWPDEPPVGKHPALVAWTDDPVNLETPLDLLCESGTTATERFFVRNHGTVPAVETESYRLRVGGLVDAPLELSLADLRRFERVRIEATLSCAGNRRGELSAVAPIAGHVPWGPGATGNAVWGGVRLRDVLIAAGVAPEARHAAFTGLDECREEGELIRFGGSIPLETALGTDVLLADEMNGGPLPPAHGFPLRMVVPGYIGARSVKWLASVSLCREPSTNHYQSRAYRLGGFALGELPVSCVVCHPQDGKVLDGGRLLARGYALTGGSRHVWRVEVSLDGGATFAPAELLGDGRPGRWRLWQAELELERGPGELVVRAWDSAAGTQPRTAAEIWNPQGYVNNAWHRVRFTVAGGVGRAGPAPES